MEKFVKGDVVVLSFPFSDLSNLKKRPALVSANIRGDDLILSQITSNAHVDDYSILLLKKDFKQGSLNLASLIKPNKLFTADKSLIEYKIGQLNQNKIKEIEKKIIQIFKN